jgi:hypothetical protein
MENIVEAIHTPPKKILKALDLEEQEKELFRMTYKIHDTKSRKLICTVKAEDPEEALDLYASQQGYHTFVDLQSDIDLPSEWSVDCLNLYVPIKSVLV